MRLLLRVLLVPARLATLLIHLVTGALLDLWSLLAAVEVRA